MDARLNVLRQNRVQHFVHARFERIQRAGFGVQVVVDLARISNNLDRQHAQHAHLLHHHVDEFGEDDVELGNPALLIRLHIRVDQCVRDRFGDFNAGLVGIAFPRTCNIAIAILVVRHSATTIHVQFRLLALLIEAG